MPFERQSPAASDWETCAPGVIQARSAGSAQETFALTAVTLKVKEPSVEDVRPKTLASRTGNPDGGGKMTALRSTPALLFCETRKLPPPPTLRSRSTRGRIRIWYSATVPSCCDN